MADLNDLRVDTENLLYGFAHELRPLEDTLVNAITSTATAAEFDLDDDVWKDGDFAEFVPDGEMVILDGDHPADGNDATIRRAQRGTTAAAQDAGDVVRRNSTFPISLVERFVNETVDIDLHRHPRVYNTAQRTLTWSSSVWSYALDAADDDVLDVYQYDLDSEKGYWFAPRSWWDVVTPDTGISSTKHLILRGVKDESQTVYYTAKGRPSSSAITSLSADIVSIVPWRAAAKCVKAKLAQVVRDTSYTRGEVADMIGQWDLEFTQGKAAIRDKLRSDNPPQRKKRSWLPVRNT